MHGEAIRLAPFNISLWSGFRTQALGRGGGTSIRTRAGFVVDHIEYYYSHAWLWSNGCTIGQKVANYVLNYHGDRE